MDIKIKSLTVSASSRRAARGSEWGSEDNFVSFAMEKEDGEPLTPEEAVLAKMRMSRTLKRLLLLDELAQGLITKQEYESQKGTMEERYGQILRKLELDPGCMLRDLKEEGCSPKT